ncbi:MAG: DUF4392 domain-containing protein [Candidatus Bathyarchaeia archaeon]
MEKKILQKAFLIDQIVTVNLPTRAGMQQLYEAAKALQKKPLCLAAAEKIIDATSHGDNVFIITGFPVPPTNVCETDGPPGAVVLTETLKEAKLNPIIITDKTCMDVVEAISQKRQALEFPMDESLAETEAEKLFAKYSPALLVSIERPGWNEKKVYHTMGGLNISTIVGKTDILFVHAQRRKVATVAVGDGGNELGCGAIANAVKKNVPFGLDCKCGCNGGIAAATPADVLAIARVSNWGAYGIATCLALIENLVYRHDWNAELQLLNSVIEAGGIDSVTKEAKPFVDGLSTEINCLIADLLWRIAKS